MFPTKRFLQFKLNLIPPILRKAHIDVEIADAGHIKYVGRHCPELIPPTENKDEPQKRCKYVRKMEDETIVNIDTKFVPTTLTYALPHASKNIKKNKIEGVTEH